VSSMWESSLALDYSFVPVKTLGGLCGLVLGFHTH
jgi:hypothetical protein